MYDPWPRYWVPEFEVWLRSARVPSSLKRALREENPDRCLRFLAEWLTGYFAGVEGRAARESDLTRVLGRNIAWRTVLGVVPDRFFREPKILAGGSEMQRETPLSTEDVSFLSEYQEDPPNLTRSLVDRKQPRWLMGWRDITNSTNERTVIASVFPKVGTGDTLLLKFPVLKDARLFAALNAMFCSLTLDYICRQKIGGTHLKYNVFKQNAVLTPSDFLEVDLAFITPRVLELTYTSNSMRAWASDLGYSAAPFGWNETRRAMLRAELDAFFARKYGLTRDELRYVLDPGDAKTANYPSETFRVLKNVEEVRYNEYRTGKLVLSAWDRMAENSLGEKPAEIRVGTSGPRILRDGAWARPMPAGPGDAGAMLAAILKAMAGPMPTRQVRLAATFGLEPRLLLPHLDPSQAAEWQRLIGAEAAPLTGSAASFAPRVDRTWGSAVTGHRGNGRLVENLTAGTWAPGSGLDAIDTAGWPDGRAGMLMRVLPHIATDAVISAMPAEIRGWIDAAAA